MGLKVSVGTSLDLVPARLIRIQHGVKHSFVVARYLNHRSGGTAWNGLVGVSGAERSGVNAAICKCTVSLRPPAGPTGGSRIRAAGAGGHDTE